MSNSQRDLIARANASIAAAARALSADPQRPCIHFLPPANWMNDPNGMILWKDRYHLFYQHNPYGPLWGNMHWGHAVSGDLIRWQHLPAAIAPTPGGPDKDGIYSGCCVDDGGRPTAVYTGVRPECQCLAVGDEDLLTWEKEPANPVIAKAPPGYDAGFRDPWVWQEGAQWRMLVGSGRVGHGGAVLLYRSKDLRRWEYLGPMVEGDARETGRMWECPFFFPLGDKHVLVIHPIPMSRAIYMVGRYADGRFLPETAGSVDHGTQDFYATHFIRDRQGRQVMVAWLREARSQEAQQRAGWSGCLSLPREVYLKPDGHLGQRPLPELAALRRKVWRAENVRMTRERMTLTSELGGESLEVRVQARLLESGTLTLRLRRSPEGQEETLLIYDRWNGTLTLDRQRSSLDATVNRGPKSCPLKLGAEEALDLTVYLDRSVVEVFANGGTAMTCRIYPTRADSTGVDFLWTGSTTEVERFEVCELA